MKKYENIFFDLDRTLWDLDANSKETLLDIFNESSLSKNPKIEFENFFSIYTRHNDLVWYKYRQDLITKEALRIDRFTNTFAELNIEDPNNDVAEHFAEAYIQHAPKRNKLHEGAIDILDYLKSKGYRLHIITNGFKEVQFIKLHNANLSSYFEGVITSEMAGFNKPNPEIFHYSLRETRSEKEGSIYIGDDFEVDVLGAQNAGMDQVYYNFQNKTQNSKATFEITSLVQLKNIF